MSSKKLAISSQKVDRLSLGLRIRDIRKSKSLSIRALAKEMGISFSLLGFYERGRRRVPVDILLTIARLGSVSLDWLITGQEVTYRQDNGERYHSLWEDSPISLWEEDCSQAKKYLDSLHDKGVEDFEQYFDNHPEVVGYCLALFKITDVNQTTLQLYQAQSKEELIHEPHFIYTEESYDCFKKNLVALAEGRKVFECETTTQTLKGDKIHITMRRGVAPGYEDTYERVFVSIVDITKLKVAEEQLKQDHQLFNFLMDNVPDLIYFKDKERRFIKVNKALAELLGVLDSSKVRGKTDFDFQSEERAKEISADEENIFKSGLPLINKLECQSLPGQPSFWTSTTKVPIYNPKGEIFGLVGISRKMPESELDNRIKETVKSLK
jgi:PAS domain S-box-containing protein